ncbi:MAG TPA: M20/M25/M40 family metallo-hydrolase [Planctomycetota bacterium]|nr:M20/M25/M40 family metallo-hydrolase [Planctomycetota bacterium]
MGWTRRALWVAAAVVGTPLLYSYCQSVPPRPEVAALLATIERQRLVASVHDLAAPGPRPESDRRRTAATLDWLEAQLREFGLVPTRETYQGPTRVLQRPPDSQQWVMTEQQGLPHCNLIAERHGSSEAATVLEVGAHYDSMPWAPGADDNGSGVAALLEVGRLLAKVTPRRSVRLLFFAQEEEGLLGSRAHVKLLRERGERITGMIALDMLGFTAHAAGSQRTPLRVPLLFSPPDRGEFLVDAGNFASGWLGNLYEACADAYVPAARYYSVNRLAGWFADAMRSDHAPYWEAGIPGLLLTDTAEMRNPNYHQQTDTPDTVDFEFLLANTRALAATVLHWAGVGESR